MTERELDAALAAAAQDEYREFSRRLTPTAYPILGVRIPVLRRLAASAPEPWLITPDSFEKVMVRGFAVARRKLPLNEYEDSAESFLPLIDNWAVCDSFAASLKPFSKAPERVFDRFVRLKDGGEWERRFLAVMIMDYCLEEPLTDRALDVYRDMKQGEYYVDMAVAWGLATALVDHYDKTCARLSDGEYSASVAAKTVSKARDSLRISDERKAMLAELRERLQPRQLKARNLRRLNENTR